MLWCIYVDDYNRNFSWNVLDLGNLVKVKGSIMGYSRPLWQKSVKKRNEMLQHNIYMAMKTVPLDFYLNWTLLANFKHLTIAFLLKMWSLSLRPHAKVCNVLPWKASCQISYNNNSTWFTRTSAWDTVVWDLTHITGVSILCLSSEKLRGSDYWQERYCFAAWFSYIDCKHMSNKVV